MENKSKEIIELDPQSGDINLPVNEIALILLSK